MFIADYLDYFSIGLAFGLISCFVGWGVGAIYSFYTEVTYVDERSDF
jgi:hypothetical protein